MYLFVSDWYVFICIRLFGSSISEFVIDLHLWFKMSAARREYELLQEDMGLAKHNFLKDVECWWLSPPSIAENSGAAEMVKEVFP